MEELSQEFVAVDQDGNEHRLQVYQAAVRRPLTRRFPQSGKPVAMSLEWRRLTLAHRRAETRRAGCPTACRSHAMCCL